MEEYFDFQTLRKPSYAFNLKYFRKYSSYKFTFVGLQEINPIFEDANGDIIRNYKFYMILANDASGSTKVLRKDQMTSENISNLYDYLNEAERVGEQNIVNNYGEIKQMREEIKKTSFNLKKIKESKKKNNPWAICNSLDIKDKNKKERCIKDIKNKKKACDILPGGLGDNKHNKKFKPEQLAKGIKVELEHTDDIEIAKEIAKDHLIENSNYYDYLEKMEKSWEK